MAERGNHLQAFRWLHGYFAGFHEANTSIKIQDEGIINPGVVFESQEAVVRAEGSMMVSARVVLYVPDILEPKLHLVDRQEIDSALLLGQFVPAD